eukprot:563653-Amphidinium_carterae.1
MTQSRPDIAVWIHSLQRAAKTPQRLHAVKLNSLVKDMKKNQCGLRYERLESHDLELHLFSDAAYRVQPESPSGLAVRGSCIALTAASTCKQDSLIGKIHLIDYQSVKQKRVTRSTYAAELNGLADAAEQATMTKYILAELLDPELQKQGDTTMVKQLASRALSHEMKPVIHAYTDARSVYDSITIEDFHMPTEASQSLVLLSLREEATRRRLR